MRNLWLFLTRYNAFFLFTVFEVIALILLIKNNDYQQAAVINSSNSVIGSLYERINKFNNYISLDQVNDRLAAENAQLRAQLKSSFYTQKVDKKTIIDSTYEQQYTYIVAKVVNNSIHQQNNY